MRLAPAEARSACEEMQVRSAELWASLRRRAAGVACASGARCESGRAERLAAVRVRIARVDRREGEGSEECGCRAARSGGLRLAPDEVRNACEERR